MNRLGFVIIIFASFVVSACSIFKQTPDKPAQEKSEVNVDSLASANAFSYKTFSAGIKIQIQGEENKDSFNGRLRARRDSIIWLSMLTPFGMEGMRLKITPDSLKIINRLEQYYFKGELKTLRNIFGFYVNFDDLQRVLFADFIINENLHFASESSVDLDENSSVDFNSQHLVQLYEKDYEERGVRFRSHYNNYVNTHAGWFPKKILLTYYERVKLQITFDYSSIKVNTDVSFPFSIPSGYNFNKF